MKQNRQSTFKKNNQIAKFHSNFVLNGMLE